MDNQKRITIVNGLGTGNIPNGSYEVSSTVVGYEESSFSPQSIDVTDQSTSFSFTISANGVLTLHVSETGETSGTAIVGATFKRCDSNGVEYGPIITSNAEGIAVFPNVPYSQDGNIPIYFKQLNSDDNHNYNSQLQSQVLTTSTYTLEIENSLPSVQTFVLTDSNYENLPIISATIILN